MTTQCTPRPPRHPSAVGSTRRNVIGLLTSAASAALLIACSDAPTGPLGKELSSSRSAHTSVGPEFPGGASSGSESAVHRVIHVDAAAAPGGDGSGRAPYRSVGDAVARANALGGGTIEIESGVYVVSSTIHVKSPMSIRGSNNMQSDRDGLPTGVLAGGKETRIIGAAALGTLPLITVGRSDGPIQGVVIANLTVQRTGLQGVGLEIIRTQGFTVRNSVFTGASFGISTIASSGRIVGNYFTSNGCGTCVAGGNATSPATVEFKGNRSVRNTLAGLLLNGSGTSLVEEADVLDATVRDNDIGENSGSPSFGYGIRIFVIRRDGPDRQTTGNVRATFTNNRVRHNKIGLVVDAGFPYRTVRGVPDPRLYSGSVDLSLRENTITGNVMKALVTFTRSTAALNQSQLNPSATGSSYKYLQSATYRIVDPDGSLAGYRMDHPTTDPVDHRQLDNELWYNGRRVSNGRILP